MGGGPATPVRVTATAIRAAVACAALFFAVPSAAEVCARAGVNVFDAGHARLALAELPVGFYKDFGATSLVRDVSLAYVPILTWQAINDRFWTRTLASAAFLSGQVPHPDGTGLSEFLDQISYDRLRERIRRNPGRFPPGTLFLVGVEPGYRPNGDARTPHEIVRDAAALRALLDEMGRDYRLGLGGISTPHNEFTRAAYGGIYGLEFLDRILAEPRRFEFDAFVIHPYPSDPSRPDAADSAEQIREARRLLARHGLRDRELMVGEIGAPFRGVDPADVARYAAEIVEYMLTASDAETGDPQDGNRLVQRFAWLLLQPLHKEMPGFSDNPALDFTVSSLLEPDGNETAVGRAFFRALREFCSPAGRSRGRVLGARSSIP